MERPALGVDIGKREHYAVAVDAEGTQILSRRVANRQEAIDELVAWAAANGAVVIVDQPHGAAALLIQACWDASVRVGYLHGLAMARARDFYEGEAKTDPKDAFVIADVARAHPTRIAWMNPTTEELAQLQLLCGHDEDLRADANRTANRLRALLATHWPAVEQVTQDRLSRAVCQLLAAYPTPQKMQAAGRARLVRFLRTRRMRKPDIFVDALLTAATEQHTAIAGAAAAGQLIATLATDLDRLHARRDDLAKEVEACFFALPQATILTSLPGIGPRLGARILVEIGDIARFPTAAKLAAYAGLGPSPRQSGTTINANTPSRRGNHRLKNALFLAAFASLRHPPSRTYYERKRLEGKGHNEAVSCLARRRVDVLHAMLTTHTPYTWTPPAPEADTPAA